jgi:hypothetical protein
VKVEVFDPQWGQDKVYNTGICCMFVFNYTSLKSDNQDYLPQRHDSMFKFAFCSI